MEVSKRLICHGDDVVHNFIHLSSKCLLSYELSDLEKHVATLPKCGPFKVFVYCLSEIIGHLYTLLGSIDLSPTALHIYALLDMQCKGFKRDNNCCCLLWNVYMKKIYDKIILFHEVYIVSQASFNM